MGIVSGHGEVIDERGREFDPRTERDAPNGDARFGATGPVRSPYRANATVHGMTDSNPLLNVERQNPLFCSTPRPTTTQQMCAAVGMDFYYSSSPIETLRLSAWTTLYSTRVRDNLAWGRY